MTVYASFETEIKAQFFDVDSLSVVWHGHYVRYLEEARCDLLDSIGYNYNQMRDSGYMWPIVDMHLRYFRPVKFRQTVIVRSELVEYEFKLKIRYTIYDKETGEKICKAHTEQVAVDIHSREMEYMSPPALVERVRRLALERRCQ